MVNFAVAIPFHPDANSSTNQHTTKMMNKLSPCWMYTSMTPYPLSWLCPHSLSLCTAKTQMWRIKTVFGWRPTLVPKPTYSFWLKHENDQYIWICADLSQICTFTQMFLSWQFRLKQLLLLPFYLFWFTMVHRWESTWWISFKKDGELKSSGTTLINLCITEHHLHTDKILIYQLIILINSYCSLWI